MINLEKWLVNNPSTPFITFPLLMGLVTTILKSKQPKRRE